MFPHIVPTLRPALPHPHPALRQLAGLYTALLVQGGCLILGAVQFQLLRPADLYRRGSTRKNIRLTWNKDDTGPFRLAPSNLSDDQWE